MPLRRLTERQYQNAIRDLFRGQIQPSERFPASELGASRSHFSTEPDANVTTLLGAENILDSAEETALAVADRLPSLLPCSATTPNEACAGTFIDDVARRAYRRPLAAEERTLLLGVYRKATPGPDAFKDGIALVVATILQAPQFLYLVEVGKPAGTNLIELTDYEIATRLSFLLWDALPDAALLDAASKGALHMGPQIRAQAERMLADPKARATIVRFAREWTDLHVWNAGEKASRDFTAALATSMQSEFDLFMQGAFLDTGGGMRSLLTSSSTFANSTLAALYGVAPPAGAASDLRPMAVDARTRAGLLTLPAFLSSAAHGDQPSYVQRGVFVLQKLLCRDLPEPPPDAAQRAPMTAPNASQRQKSTAIRAVAECGVCHAMIDPIGLGFDGYDEIGRVRATLPATQGGGPVDQRGEVKVGLPVDGSFNGPVELAGKLAASPDAQACLGRQWFRFAMSRLDVQDDACSINNLGNVLGGNGQTLRELVLALTAAEEFRFRRLGGAL